MAEIEGERQPRPEPRRSFTEEFKREAVRLAVERGNVSAVARDLDIHDSVLSDSVLSDSVLSRWKRQLRQESEHPGPGTRPFPGNGNRQWQPAMATGNGNARDEEMIKLQRENARLQEENAILKKAVGIFTSRPA
jgi:transposase